MDALQQEEVAVRPVALDKVVPFGGQPRRAFDPESMRGLADSIKAVGVLQAIVLRPLPAKLRPAARGRPPEAYEIVAGERRWRAAGIAGLKHIPARVVDLTDHEAKDVRLVENDQREDITPSERAAAYQERIGDGVSVEQLAATVGKSVSTVRNVLRYGRLPAAVLAAVDKGDLPRTVAELVARVPTDFLRGRVGECVLKGCGYIEMRELCDPKVKIEPDQLAEYDGPLSYRDTKDLVTRCVAVELKSAPFPRTALVLLPAVGSCDACPKRAGNMPELAADGIRGDVCLDPQCYQQKCAAWRTLQEDAAKRDGLKVLTAKECEDVMGHDRVRYDGPYVDLADTVETDGAKRPRSYKQLVGKELADQVVVAFDRRGEKHQLVPRGAAVKVLREKGVKADRPAHTANGSDSYRAQERAREKKARAYKAAAALAIGAVAAKAEGALFASGADPAKLTPVLRALAGALADTSHNDVARLVARRRDPECKSERFTDTVYKLATSGGSAGELFGLIAELVAGRLAEHWCFSHYSGHMDGEEKAFWQAFGVDRAKLLRQAEAERAAKKKAKAQPSANGAPKGNGKPKRAKAAAGV